jgi:glc operon protein GlcG
MLRLLRERSSYVPPSRAGSIGATALLPTAASAQFAVKKVLTLEVARKVVAAAEAEAARNHLAGVVAVVDDGGWPILI